MATEQQVNGKFTFLLFSHDQSPSISWPQWRLSANTDNPGTNEPNFCDSHEGWKECFCNSCSHLACFPKCSHYYLTPYPEQTADKITPHIFVNADAVKSIRGWQNENWTCNGSIHGENNIIQEGRPNWWFCHKRKLQISLCVLKVPNGWLVVRMQGTHKKISISWYSET